MEASLSKDLQIYKAVLAIARHVVNVVEPTQFLHEVCKVIVDVGGLSMAWIGGVQPGTDLLVPLVSYGDGTQYLDGIRIVTNAQQPEGLGPSALAYRQGECVLAQDFLRDPRTKPWHERAETYGWNSSGCFPIFRAGRTHAVLTVYSVEKGFFQNGIVDLLNGLATDIGNALNILDREQARLKASKDLSENQSYLRTLIETLPDLIWLKDLEGTYLDCNRRFEQFLGHERAAVVGKTDYDFVDKELADSFRKNDCLAVESNDSHTNEEWVTFASDGHRELIETTKTPLYANGKVIGVLGIGHDITQKNKAELKLKGEIQRRSEIEAAQSQTVDELRQTTARLDQTLRQTITAFSTAMAHNDPYTAGHEYRVADLCLCIGRNLGLDEDRLVGLEFAARCHDIGQIKVPAEILLRTEKLVDIELDFIKQHVDVGWDILRSIDFPWPVAEIVRQHHENFDGTGYPRGLAGDDLLLESRILRIADVVEALSSHRPYRASRDRNSVIEEILAHRGTHFDAVIVDACLEVLSEGYQFPPPPKA